jgi:predicted aspartyl protease
MVRRLVGLSLLALASSSAVGAQQQTTKFEAVQGSAQVDKTTQTEDVRFRNELNERMTVPVRLSGTGPYRFLVDTGASRTAISRQLAARLNLAAGAGVALHSIAGVSTVSTAMVPSLQLTRKGMRIVDAPLLDSVNMGADGILGVDSLASQRVEFNFATQTMSIVPSAAPAFIDEPGTIVIEARRRSGRLVVTDATANGRHVIVVLDTGSEVSIGNEPLRDQLLGGKFVSGSQEVVLESVTGEKILGDYMFVRSLEIGGVTLKNLAVVFARAHTFDQLKLNKKPALLLGMNAMRAFKKVSIDFAASKLRVVVPERSELDVQEAGGVDPARLRLPESSGGLPTGH